MTNKPGNEYADLQLWKYAGPSRKLRKLYAELAAVYQELERARGRTYCAEHGPTDCRARAQALRPLRRQAEHLETRIGRLNGDDC